MFLLHKLVHLLHSFLHLLPQSFWALILPYSSNSFPYLIFFNTIYLVVVTFGPFLTTLYTPFSFQLSNSLIFSLASSHLQTLPTILPLHLLFEILYIPSNQFISLTLCLGFMLQLSLHLLLVAFPILPNSLTSKSSSIPSCYTISFSLLHPKYFTLSFYLPPPSLFPSVHQHIHPFILFSLLLPQVTFNVYPPFSVFVSSLPPYDFFIIHNYYLPITPINLLQLFCLPFIIYLNSLHCLLPLMFSYILFF